MKKPEPSFEALMACFAEHELPITLTEETLTAFQQMHDPIPGYLVDAFFTDGLEQIDAFTEIVPCFRIPDTHEFHAVVFWKGELMKYQFILTTFDLKGKPIASAAIAGLQSDGATVLRSIATIEEDWKIHIVEGEQGAEEEHYQPTSTRAYEMELLSTGEIVMSGEE
jgi:hypothetical protein